MAGNFFNVQFPESLFPISAEKIPSYAKYVNIGADYSERVLVLGLARDCERELSLNLDRFEYSHVKCDFFIVESDSYDRTSEIVLSRNIGISLKNNLPRMSGKSLLRRFAMAILRNKYMDYLSTCSNYKYVIIYDFDIVGGFSYEGLYHSIGLLETHADITAVTANGLTYEGSRRLFYDTWAFKPTGNSMSEQEVNLLHLNRGEPTVDVKSNFGGMAIYRAQAINGLRYTHHDCDHVTLHSQMNGRIVLNPSLIVLYVGHNYANTTDTE